MPPGSVALVLAAEMRGTLPGSVAIVPGGRAGVVVVDISVSIALKHEGRIAHTSGGRHEALRLMKVGSLSRTLLCHNRVQDRPREICPNTHKYYSVGELTHV